MDVEHEVHGRGWVWGSGRGVVTVRFETAETGPGRVLSFAVADPELAPFRPAGGVSHRHPGPDAGVGPAESMSFREPHWLARR